MVLQKGGLTQKIFKGNFFDEYLIDAYRSFEGEDRLSMYNIGSVASVV